MRRKVSKTKPKKKSSAQFSVVGIGLSAGGLEAISQLLAHLSPDTGLSFILIQHLAPGHASTLVDILSRTTRMPVSEIKNRERIEPNHIYVIPPNFDVTLVRGALKLQPRTSIRGQHTPIDFLFRSLAKDQKSKSIGVVLSGTATDGTLGVKVIKAQGGITIAQDPKSAKHDGMPRSAIESGAVDLVLDPQKIALELNKISEPGYVKLATEVVIEAPKELPTEGSDPLGAIITVLRSASHLDFSQYKTGTIGRRIKRRMGMRKISDLKTYARFVQKNPEEATALSADLLIHVTGFFRDKSTFEALKKRVFPKLVKTHPKGAPIRIWVPGCSTGEEAYSLAIALLEYMEANRCSTAFQIFASDVSESAIQTARRGIYPETISEQVSPQRLRQYFEKMDAGYKVAKSVRDRCLFSRHDVTNDPPFARIDFISCHNVLIYFTSELQKRVIPIFHYALNPEGFLWLGRSESLTGFPNLFHLVDKINKIYTKKGTARSAGVHFQPTPFTPLVPITSTARRMFADSRLAVQREADRLALEEYAPPGILVDDAMEILQARGRTSPFLSLAPGQASLNLMKMASPELAGELRRAIQAAKKSDAPIERAGLSIQEDGGLKKFTLRVTPLKISDQSKEKYFSIVFEGTSPPTAAAARGERIRKSRNAPPLRGLISREHQTLIEEFESTREELISANEELQSSNEELQSTNEEIETAKEELQSGNEELSTVNEELQTRNAEIVFLNNDLTNLLASVDIPIVMVGNDGKIRRFTPKAAKSLSLIHTDIGRPIGDIKPKIKVVELDDIVSEVMDTMVTKEIETQDREGLWHKLVVRPYRTAENKIDGAVIALLNIDDLKRSALELAKSRDDAQTVVESMPVPLLLVESDLKIRLANKTFYETFHVAAEDTKGRFLFNLGEGQWNIPALLRLVSETLNQNVSFTEFEVEHTFPQIGNRTMLLNARQVQLVGSGTKAALLAIEDITDRVKLGKERRTLMLREKAAREQAEAANRTKDLFLATLSHELRTPLTTILAWSQLIQKVGLKEEKIKRGVKMIEDSGKALGQLIDDLMDVSRIQSGKLPIECIVVDPSEVIKSTVDSVRLLAESKSIHIESHLNPNVKPVFADPSRLKQIVVNLLTNAIKFSPSGTSIEIQVDLADSSFGRACRIQVRDQGKGIDPKFLPNIFRHFSQADSSTTRADGGLGLGLAIVRGLVEMHGGTVQAASEGVGKGSVFTVLLPLATPAQQAGDASAKVKADLKAAETNSSATPLRGVRILVVDDDANAREVICEMLTDFGAKVATAASAKFALHAIQEFKPQVLVSDIAMPEEDGYSLIRNVRKLAPNQGGDLPCIAVTAHAAAEDRKRALSSGFDAYLAKPFDGKVLAAQIIKLKNGRVK